MGRRSRWKPSPSEDELFELLESLQMLSSRRARRTSIISRYAYTHEDVPVRCAPRRGRSDGQPNKIIFPNEAAAKRCAEDLHEEEGFQFYAYRCPRRRTEAWRPHHRHWHLATRKRDGIKVSHDFETEENG